MRRMLLVLLLAAGPLQAAQSIDPVVFQALQEAQRAQQKGDYGAARRSLEKTSPREGSLEDALICRSRGYLAWAEGDNRRALEWLEKSYATGKLDDQAQAEERLNLARLNLVEGRYRRVVKLLSPLPEKAPEEQLKMLVQAYQGLAQHDRALPLAERYVRANPNAEDTWLQLLVAGNASLKRYAEAERWQRQLLLRTPDQTRAWWQLAGLQQMAGEEQRALATLRTARTKGLNFTEGELDNLVLMASAAEQPWQGARLLEGMIAEGLLQLSPARQERLGVLWWQARERARAASAYRELAGRTGQAGHWMNVAQLELEQANWRAGLDALGQAERAGADHQTVRDWRQWAESEMGMDKLPQFAQRP
ncbi:hypothetical protein [Stutzerimonas tarimensis]|uniref:Tetratricopeptide repeat protein n=1 Tax=Stutzerimonas tarimensis TaxID=1507735 RepID=A0ABV7T2R4_9GAMM